MDNDTTSEPGYKLNSAFLTIIILLVIAVFHQKLNSDQYLTLIQSLAWPLSVLSIALIFEKEIGALFGRITNAKLPGGIEFQTSQQLIAQNPLLEGTTSDEGIPNSQEELEEFKKLDSFLAGNSKAALKWFKVQGESITHLSFLINFSLPFPQTNPEFNYLTEKGNVFQALSDTYLIESPTTGKFTISSKGQRYLKHLSI